MSSEGPSPRGALDRSRASTRDSVGRWATAHVRRNLVLVVGLGRSGTTALERALGEHPLLRASPAEAPALRAVGVLAHSMRDGANAEYVRRQTRLSWHSARSQLQRLGFETVFGDSFGLDGRLLVSNWRSPGDLLDLRSAHGFVAKVGGIGRPALDGLGRIFDSVRVVYLHRNGIANVESRCQFRSFRDRPFDEHCQTWVDHARSHDYLRERSDATVASHDELVDEPEALFDRLFDFIGVGASEAAASYTAGTLVHPQNERTRDRIDARRELTQRESPYLGWSDDQRRTFVGICGPTMSRLGYEIPEA